MRGDCSKTAVERLVVDNFRRGSLSSLLGLMLLVFHSEMIYWRTKKSWVHRMLVLAPCPFLTTLASHQ